MIQMSFTPALGAAAAAGPTSALGDFTCIPTLRA